MEYSLCKTTRSYSADSPGYRIQYGRHRKQNAAVFEHYQESLNPCQTSSQIEFKLINIYKEIVQKKDQLVLTSKFEKFKAKCLPGLIKSIDNESDSYLLSKQSNRPILGGAVVTSFN